MQILRTFLPIQKYLDLIIITILIQKVKQVILSINNIID